MFNEHQVPGLEGQLPNETHALCRIGAAPYLENLPLLAGLEQFSDVDLVQAPPSEMIEMLISRLVDVALLPSIDLQHAEESLVVIPAGCISSTGRTFTARVYSQVRPNEIGTLWADMASHSSLTLAKLLWAENYRRLLRVIPFDPVLEHAPHDAEAVLLIGDKVVADPPLGFDWQLDLGAMWFELTGLPFTFNAWATVEEADHAAIYERLLAARMRGLTRLEQIANRHGPLHGWPEDLALRQLSRHTRFEFTDDHRDGLEEFFDRAESFRIIDRARPVYYYEP